MRSSKSVGQEHKKACAAMARIIKRGGGHMPLAEDTEVYGRLAIVKYALEWVHPLLVRTEAQGSDRLNALMGYNHIACGPTHAVLYS
jgi:hypothetical protein